MTQPPLLNYQILATTKAVRHAQRARRDTILNKSKTIAADNSSVQREECLQKPTAKRTSLQTSCAETESEFNLPDEDRKLTILNSLPRCYVCGTVPELERKSGKYRVKCWHYCKTRQTCPEPTPWLDSSAAAIRVWTITRKLTEL